MGIRSQALGMGGYPISGLADGTEPDHAVNKGQLDAAVADAVSDGSIGTDELADGGVTLQKLNSGTYASQAQAEAGSDNTHLMTPLRVKQYALANPPAVPAQKLVASGYAEYASWTNITASIPNDNTVPQSTEGTQILSVTLTTTSATQKVRLSVSVMAFVFSGSLFQVAIFQGTSCIFVTSQDCGGKLGSIAGSVEVTPGSAGTFTFTVRVGGVASGSAFLNGTNLSQLFGGAAKCTLTAMVIEP